jgi:hypothetical protein
MFGNCSSKDLEARVVNNALVVSFLTADPPRVWRADMSGLASASLELREGTPGKFRLVMKTGAGKEEDISTFTDKEAAHDALRAVTSAMLRGDGSSSGSSSASSAPSAGGGILKGVLWVVGVVVVLFIGAHLLVLAGGPGGGKRSHLPADVKQGTAVPADKIFGGK